MLATVLFEINIMQQFLLRKEKVCEAILLKGILSIGCGSQKILPSRRILLFLCPVGYLIRPLL
jgi:hypothetical protein